MSVQVMNRVAIELDVGALDEEALDNLAAAIVAAAPKSDLYAQSPVIQAGVTSIADAHQQYKDKGAAVIQAEQQLVTDRQAEADARVTLVTRIVQVKGLIETTAKTPAQVLATGYEPLEKQAPGAIAPPVGIDIFYPKGRKGRAKVTAQSSTTDRSFGAQLCLDLAQNSWTDLDGHAKSHWLTSFSSGTVVWVRFRTIRGHQKSEWCAPVSVTIP